MNRVFLMGRLTRDPEVRYTQSGKARAFFNLAVDRRLSKEARETAQQTADFIPIVAWDRLAETIGNNLTKGRQVLIEARISTRSYDDQDGNRKFAMDIVADNVHFLGSRNDNSGGNFGGGNNFGGYDQNRGGYGQGYSQPQQQPQIPDAPSASSFGASVPEEEIPF